MSGEALMTPQARALRIAAQLLTYPTPDLSARLPLLARAATACGPASRSLTAMIDTLSGVPLPVAEAAYVDTFDLRRRCCLYLTYYTHGDTRKRGMALLRFSHAYRTAGFELADSELPDHLAVVCEFTAAAPETGLQLLREHRVAVELMRIALADADSPYLHVIDGIRGVLPDPAPADLDRARALVQSGPPAEEVGLEPFGPPEYMGGRR